MTLSPRITPEQYRAMVGPKNKYGVSAPADRTYDGVLYASKAEAMYAQSLDLLRRAGAVKEWFRQVPFVLKVNDILIATFVIDFRVEYSDGRIEHIEIKGMELPTYKLKLKLFQALYPKTKLTVVKVK